jgi:hypothetical protein
MYPVLSSKRVGNIQKRKFQTALTTSKTKTMLNRDVNQASTIHLPLGLIKVGSIDALLKEHTTH